MYADDLLHRVEAENDVALAQAEAAAAEAGKEPFDLARLEQLFGEDRGSLADQERYLRIRYYVAHPELQTLTAFVEFQLQMEVWDGSQMRSGDGPFG